MIEDESDLIDLTYRLRGVFLLRTAIQWNMDGKKARNNSMSLWLYKIFYFILLSFIHSKIYIAPLQGNYSEALPTPVRTKR